MRNASISVCFLQDCIKESGLSSVAGVVVGFCLSITLCSSDILFCVSEGKAAFSTLRNGLLVALNRRHRPGIN